MIIHDSMKIIHSSLPYIGIANKALYKELYKALLALYKALPHG